MTRSPIDRFFAIRSRKLLLDPDFVLALESDMLFPSKFGGGLALHYSTFLALLAGPDSIPTAANFVEPAPPLRGAMGAYPNTQRNPAPDEPPLGPWRDRRGWDWNGDAGVQVPDKFLPRSIEVELGLVKELRPFRIAVDQSRSLEKLATKEIRKATAEGQICAVCLEMLRLLVGTELRTKKQARATPSMNLVARICEAYNFERARPPSGNPKGGRNSYGALEDQKVQKVWRTNKKSAALWAAHRALSPLPFDSVPPGHLLNKLDLDEFIRLSFAYEDDRLAIEAKQAITPLNALGPSVVFEALRKVVETHVPDYEVIKKSKKAKKAHG